MARILDETGSSRILDEAGSAVLDERGLTDTDLPDDGWTADERHTDWTAQAAS